MQHLVTSRIYGTAGPDQQKEMTGLEFVQSLAGGTLPLNTMAETLGYEIAEAENGRVVVTAEPRDIYRELSTAVSLPRCSTVAWGGRSTRLCRKAPARRPLVSKFHSSGRLRRQLV
jgi:hypothetical protein